MKTLTLAQADAMLHELEAADPPQQVLRAAKTVVTLAAAGRRVPHDLISYVQGWLQKRCQQDRYGKWAFRLSYYHAREAEAAALAHFQEVHRAP